MTDDRDFKEYKQPRQNRGGLPSFRDYVLAVVNDPNRKEELENLIQYYGMVAIDRVVEGAKTTRLPREEPEKKEERQF